jgi:hypothetical protein
MVRLRSPQATGRYKAEERKGPEAEFGGLQVQELKVEGEKRLEAKARDVQIESCR